MTFRHRPVFCASACLQKSAYLFHAPFAGTRRGLQGDGVGPLRGDRGETRREGAFRSTRGAKPLWKCLVAKSEQ